MNGQDRRSGRRRAYDIFFKTVVYLSAFLTVALLVVLIGVLGYLTWRLVAESQTLAAQQTQQQQYSKVNPVTVFILDFSSDFYYNRI